MKISVIIPTYKPQQYIWECLNSLYNQSLNKSFYEVLVVLNGCNEPFRSFIEQWISDHSNFNVYLIHTDKGGVSNARNLALDMAKGKYVTFVDDDDYVSNTFLEQLLNKATSNTIVLSDVYGFIDGSQNRIPYRISNVYKERYSNGVQSFIFAWKYFAGPCYKLIPMSFIGRRRFNPDFSLGEDTLFMFKISDKFSSVDFAAPEALYYRRIRSESAMTKKRNKIQIINNEVRLFFAILKIYIPNFWKYDFRYLCLNLLSIIHGIIK